MTKIVSINLGNNESTGNIMRGITKCAKESGYNAICAYPLRLKNAKIMESDIVICGKWFHILNGIIDSFIGISNCGALLSTLRLLHKLKKIQPELIHLHNIHGGYINIPLLFRYIKKNNISLVWTLHDCWSFTGRCPHFILSKCNKWKTGCFECPFPKNYYPAVLADRTKLMWKLKKKWFTSIEDLTIITPSKWLADLTRESYLSKYPVKVINNGIRMDIFNPKENKFRKEYNIRKKFIVLGVSSGWSPRKGLDIFIKLEKNLGEEYQIVLVGTNSTIDKNLPPSIISIHHTSNQEELAEIYTAANVFVNPTREDTFPTVNIEALACGTPVITFKTGGSPEILDINSGIVVECDDIDSLQDAIKETCEKNKFTEENCVKRAKHFDIDNRFKDYIKIYNDILERSK